MNTSTPRFGRDKFSPEAHDRYFDKFLNQIEKLYSDFSRMPNSQTLHFVSDTEFQKLLDNPKAIENAPALILDEIYFRFQFLFFSSVYKLLKAIESLVYCWNQSNLLGWVLFGRFSIELCSVYNHFWQKLEDCGLLKTDYTIEQLNELERILIKYSHGTRFDWDALLGGDFEKLKEKFAHTDQNKAAINILTAIDKLASLRPAFRDVRVIYDMLSDYAHPNMGSHSLFIKLADMDALTGKNTLSLNADSMRAEFIIVGTLPQIATCLTYCGHLLQETAKVIKLWGGFSGKKVFTVKFRNTTAVLKLKNTQQRHAPRRFAPSGNAKR